MTSAIILELQDNVKEIQSLVSKQKFTVGHANKYLERYTNISRRMEQLEESRDYWKNKFHALNSSKENIPVEKITTGCLEELEDLSQSPSQTSEEKEE